MESPDSEEYTCKGCGIEIPSSGAMLGCELCDIYPLCLDCWEADHCDH